MKTRLRIFATALSAFVLAIIPATAATVSASNTAPVIDGADIANLGDITGNEKWGSGTGVESPPRGQTFTTGGAAVRLKSITYQIADGGGGAPTKTYALRVGKVAGNSFTSVHAETAVQSTFTYTSNQYVTWTLSTPIILEPYTVYGIDLGITGDTAAWQLGIPYINMTGNEYPGGTSYTSGTAGVGTNYINIAISSDRIFHIDLENPTGPSFVLVAPSPTDNATDAIATRNIVMTFSQNVTPGSGNLTVRNLTDNSETLIPASDTRLTYDGNVVRLNPAGLITWSKNYAIRLDAGVFLGDGGAPISPISDDTTWNFTTLANDPLLAAIAALKGHVNNTASISQSQIAGHKYTIDNNRQRFSETAQIITAVFDLITTYETIKGPFFISTSQVTYFARDDFNTASKNSVTAENYHWAVYSTMQHAMDWIYTGEVLAQHEALLTNYKYATHTHFPGPCPLPAPAATHSVDINGSFPATFGRLTQDWTKAARKPTGTYLSPGTIATVTVPPALVNAGYKIRVGAHSWDLSARQPVVRLERGTRLYDIDSTTTKIASPYGGGIYIEVPYLASAGVVNITINGAVRSPYFSAKSFHQTTPVEWDTEKTHLAPWADFQSDKFMTQVPRKWIYNMTGTQATQLMVDWDKGMDAINDLMGFPRNRGKETMYCQPDIILRSSVHAPGYPATNVITNPNNEVDPIGYAGNYLVRGPGQNPLAANIEFHEQGHAYGFPKFGSESESAVNFLQAAMLNRSFGYSHDVAHAASLGNGSPFYTIDNTAVAWMTVFSFSPNEIPMQQAEKAYQHKGHAKYADIARMFGWTGLDNYWKSYLQNVPSVLSGNDDEHMLRLSRYVGKDIRPLCHFWGIHPQNPTALANAIAAENIPSSPEIKTQLLRYKTLIPANNAAFRTFAQTWRGSKPLISGFWEETDHAMQWDETLDADAGPAAASVRPTITVGSMYVEGCATDIRNRVQELIDIYYPNTITPGAMSFAVLPSSMNATTVGMTAVTATSTAGTIEYYFENITNTTNSGWISTPAWTQPGLTTGLSYTYRVKARDGLSNETNWSPDASVTVNTDTTSPLPTTMNFTTQPYSLSPTSISMTATAASDINDVEYYFDCTAGSGGHDSGWQDSRTYIDTGLTTGVAYTYKVQARDKSPAQNAGPFSSTASATPTDVTNPTLVSLVPAHLSTNVPGSDNLSMTFSEPIARGTGFITLKNLTDATQTQIDITDLAQTSVSGSVLTINPTANLLEGKNYAIRIDATAIDDVWTNSYAGITNDTTWSFITLDSTAPGIVSLSPVDGVTNAPANSNLVITFSENVTRGTGNIVIKNLTDTTQSTIAITDNSQVSLSGAVLTINPSADLLIGKDYAIQLPGTAITDTATNPFPGISDDFTWNFTIVIPPTFAFWQGVTGNWTAPATWVDGITTTGVGFTTNLTGIDITANQTVTLDAARTIGTLIFTDTTPSHDATINGANTLTLDRTSGVPIIDVTQAGRTLSISSNISGNDGILKTGPGTLAFSGNNNHTGTTTISSGELRLSGGAYTTAARTYQIDSGAVLSFSGNNQNPNATTTTIQGTGTMRVLNGASVFAGAGSRRFNMNLGAGSVIDIQAGGSLGLGYQPIVWTNNQAILNMDGTHDFWDDTAVTVGALTGSGAIASTSANGGAANFTLGVGNGSGTFSGNITAAGTRVVSLVKSGNGTQTLAGSSTFRGATTVNAGTLAITGTHSTSGVTVANNASLGGNGNITGNVSIASGARHSLAVAATPAAQLTRAITGTLTLTSGNILNLTSASAPGPGTYVLATATTAITGTPTTINYNGILGTVTVDTASTPKRLLLTVTGSTYASWIANYPGASAQAGFNQDADGDGVKNGVENFFGTTPVGFTAGLVPGTKTSNTFTFTHPQNATPATDITATYRWSKDLTTFHNSGVADGLGTTVTFTTQLNTPSIGITTVTATATGTPTEKLLVDVKVIQN